MMSANPGRNCVAKEFLKHSRWAWVPHKISVALNIYKTQIC